MFCQIISGTTAISLLLGSLICMISTKYEMGTTTQRIKPSLNTKGSLEEAKAS